MMFLWLVWTRNVGVRFGKRLQLLESRVMKLLQILGRNGKVRTCTRQLGFYLDLD